MIIYTNRGNTVGVQDMVGAENCTVNKFILTFLDVRDAKACLYEEESG